MDRYCIVTADSDAADPRRVMSRHTMLAAARAKSRRSPWPHRVVLGPWIKGERVDGLLEDVLAPDGTYYSIPNTEGATV